MPDSSVAIEFVQYKSIFSDKNENNYISAIVLKKMTCILNGFLFVATLLFFHTPT